MSVFSFFLTIVDEINCQLILPAVNDSFANFTWQNEVKRRLERTISFTS